MHNRVTKISLLIACAYAFPLVAEETSFDNEILNLSLEELLKVKITVPGAITKMTAAEQPSSVTTISTSQINNTPARNLYDLIEIYVPGAFWMNSETGPLLGVRGSLFNRNVKYLLLVNNRVMNSKGFFGAKSELEQWDLSDIEKVEVIRGPGSVTYGPGAVSGVISVTTKNSASHKTDSLAFRYNHRYDSKGITYQQSHQSENLNLYSFISTTRSKGDDSRFYLVDDNDELGYVGEDFLLDTEPLVYFGDYQDKPQLKLYLEAEFSPSWQMWFRYTQQGSHWKGNEVKTDFNGQLLNQQGTRDRQWTLTLNHDTDLSENVNLTSTVSLDSFDGERRIENARFPEPDSVLNFRINYSETELFAQSVVNWKIAQESELAAGVEYSYDHYGSGWGESELNLRMGDNADIVSGPDSNAILAGNRGSADRNGPAIFVGNGWSTDTYAIFAEYNTDFSDQIKLITSGRLDKSSNSNWLFSPRVTVISRLTGNRFLRFIAQKSRRLNNAGSIYIESINGEDPSSESLTNFEINYSAFFKAGHNFKTALFWNDLEIISWNGDENSSLFVGEQAVAGLELEYEYQWDSGQFGLNYSFVKQQSWQLAQGLTRSGISYSDYNQPLDDTDGIMMGTGNDINNWPNHAFKAYLDWRLNDDLLLHLDFHALWDFQGAKDGLLALENAVRGQALEAEVNNALSQVRAKDVYQLDYRLNASLIYQLSKQFELSLYFQNLIGSHDNKRYAEDSGNDDPAPRKVRFTEEPSAVGIKLQYRW